MRCGKSWKVQALATESPLDNTENCPTAKQCESCGSEDDVLVRAAQTSLGVLCVSLCEPCEEGELPKLNVQRAAIRIGMHCEHLGIDLDQMAEMMNVEKGVDSGFGR
jgi:hypothetical protein